MFKSTLNKGFQLTFKNNLTISVQFGSGNYCENRKGMYFNELSQDVTESKDAEIAIWDENNNWYNFGSDTVKGYLNSNEVAEWIEKVSKAENIYSI